jgi:hypothetical protein
MNRQKLSKRKKAAGGVTLLQQPQDLSDKAAQPEQLVERDSSSAAADLQVQSKVNYAVQELLEKCYCDNIGYFEDGVLKSYHPTLEEYLEENYRGKIYQLRASNRFYYLYDDTWVTITPDDVKRGLERKEQRRSFARYYFRDWREVCDAFGQIVWNEDIKELHGKAVIA